MVVWIAAKPYNNQPSQSAPCLDLCEFVSSFGKWRRGPAPVNKTISLVLIGKPSKKKKKGIERPSTPLLASFLPSFLPSAQDQNLDHLPKLKSAHHNNCRANHQVHRVLGGGAGRLVWQQGGCSCCNPSALNPRQARGKS
jgi:hypothetical protein